MRIALVTRRYPPLIGGAEKVLSYLAPALRDEGAEVTVVTSAIPSPASPPLPPAVPVVHLPTSRLRFVGTTLYMRALKGWLTHHRPDLIYVSMLKHDAYVAIGVGERLGIPVVLRPEGAGATGDLAWQSWGRFGKTIGRRCLRADAVVAISSPIRAELVAAGYDPAQIHDLPNGVPVPEQPWEEPRANAVAFVGRLAPEKNLAMLLDAWERVLPKSPGTLLKLIGDGPERLALEAKAVLMQLAPHSVRFLGAIEDPSTILRFCNLFVLPSREEGMSIALLEAMALGMPIVASDIPGNRRLIVDGMHGRLAPPDDPGAWAHAILTQLGDPASAARMGQQARARVIESYSINAVARLHLDLFRDLIRAKAR